MKRYWLLAAFGSLSLSCAAVWLGGLNQDEGWYLYAANLVREGKLVYRDFAFTQGPVMPEFYSAFTWIWAKWGLLGARVFTLLFGLAGIVFAAVTAKRMVGKGTDGNAAAVMVAMLLGCNLYHLYFLTIPKTYALAGFFVSIACCLIVCRGQKGIVRAVCALIGGYFLGLAAGVRISLGAILPVIGIVLLIRRGPWLSFGVGGLAGLMVSYGFVFSHPSAYEGFLAAQQYHTARGGFDLTWVVGSLSRLVRWYLPVFIVLGLGVFGSVRGKGQDSRLRGDVTALMLSFCAVFAVQMLAPFPYEDYQVPIMGLLAICAVVMFVGSGAGNLQNKLLLVFGLTYASSFGSPLLEKWSTNGQDRFWSQKKEKSELAQLRDAAKRIEEIDPKGKDLFTQDLYLAIETGRRVPKGLEMGPFSILTDAEWRKLIASAPCRVAAVTGYTFAIEPPKCNERPVEQQLEYLRLLKENYETAERMADFGQNATTLLLLRRK